ncbi:MAG: TIGR02453 family protein [Sphingobacteriales bacterium 17-39-43]|uniref:DUF2461 domain-containing protein n=1 Tax=Daejeonella sp. TaxID=2805397 RepID=UPI000BC7B7AD|nr:DUF2461 domain-containing protein [Daejeonella sp.]OYZ31069.1 MAG: TIGR02453 family protein [Sphingobacteriales bacterium 16-39-50]OZA23910.1 MAG: TIGR02453 family protein [Sphingobacteriales bacterium 17-39-43]HQS52769.1 DUF2461 domain-containing protein [Daejeonella sp.]HQT23336.1 DUF2461 domain-containing protein [Daejeonella sp.]HQT58288.1 DUF2461 domain-containing protein [Daejeonella sp.]
MINLATFDFLEDLAANNNRDWFQANKLRHDEARNNVLEFAEKLIIKLSKIDPAVSSELDPKSCVMRIYRDVRFSKNKTPYKTNFGAGFSENGKNFKGAGYYLHIHPEQSFLAGGCWMPEGDMLKAIRQEIDYNGADFHEIIDDRAFKKYFDAPDSEYKLKTPPKGYQPDHQDIEYLKLKSFTFSHALTRNELTGSNAVDEVCDGFIRLYPFIAFLRNAVS